LRSPEHSDRRRDRTRQAFTVPLDRAAGEGTTWRTALRTLSPDATLRRGYAVLRTSSGAVVRSPEEVQPQQDLEALIAQGTLQLQVTGAQAREERPTPPEQDNQDVIG